ncbi:MAG: alpha/beta hydrolase [Ancalomicrobiaceae bacterium]|nr:alpha/beta hydrolase [Ancalomicrobiaceae bacterium]
MADPSSKRDVIRRQWRALRPSRAELAGHTLEYADFGAGPAVLALHGGLGGYDQGALLGIAGFADWPNVRVLAPSRAGYLGTPVTAAEDFAAEADLHVHLLDRLGVGAAVVIAVSGGGPAAIQFAARHPGRCRGLILVSACSGRLVVPDRYRPQFERMVRMSAIPPLRWMIALMGRYAPEVAIRHSIPDADLRRRTLADPEAGFLIRALQRSTASRLRERIPGLMKDVSADAAIDRLPIEAISAPTLVIHGDADRVVPFAQAEEVVRRCVAASLLRIPRGDHLSLFTHLADVRAASAVFLAHL